MPNWVRDYWNSDRTGKGYEAVYKWYRETIFDAYEKYGNDFRAGMGAEAVKELLQEKRMQQAVYLLANSEIPVTDIIESIGYDNTSYFYRKFREKYGMSPKEYRKNYV